jgi:peptidoglycan hydrolase-like protein with peptidoglycan-binding domain
MEERNIRIFLTANPNTWGVEWNCQGVGHFIFDEYPPTEVWAILKENPMYKFTKMMKMYMRDPEVKELQKRLGMALVFQTGYFFTLTKLAVQKYQKSKGLKPDGICGPLTILELNK